jgi:hypothetical protein
MNLNITSSDPLNILSTTREVVINSKFVKINSEKIPGIIEDISRQLKIGIGDAQGLYGTTGNFEDDIQLVFIENVVNFCFWADRGKPKWRIEWPIGQETNGGWYTLKSCFERAVTENIPICDANYLANIKIQEIEHIFRGIEDTQIPLINNRLENLQEAGKILIEKYDGKAMNIIKEADYDAINLARIIYQNFSSFKDIYKINDKEVYILKRAQIAASDISFLFTQHKKSPLKRLGELTAFADYKLPQILRMFGVMEYSKELSYKVDNMIEISSGSKEETEIRSATIWATELIRQQMKNVTAAEIDISLWLISQNIQDKAKPYHRTKTIFY